MVNPAYLLKLRSVKEAFLAAHPKFPAFLRAVRDTAMEEGTVVDIRVTTPEGRVLESNLKLQASDVAAFHDIMAALGAQGNPPARNG